MWYYFTSLSAFNKLHDNSSSKKVSNYKGKESINIHPELAIDTAVHTCSRAYIISNIDPALKPLVLVTRQQYFDVRVKSYKNL